MKEYPILFAILAIISLSACEPNPYALTESQIIQSYKSFSDKHGSAMDKRIELLSHVSFELENYEGLSLDNDSRGEPIENDGKYYGTMNPDCNFFCVTYDVLRGNYPTSVSAAMFDGYSIAEFQNYRMNGYELSSGPPYDDEGRTGNLSNDTISALKILQADYLGVLYPIEEVPGMVIDGQTFVSGSFAGIAFLYDLHNKKVMDAFLFTAANSEEVSYSSAWGDDDETTSFVLKKDLDGQVRYKFYKGFEERCDFEY